MRWRTVMLGCFVLSLGVTLASAIAPWFVLLPVDPQLRAAGVATASGRLGSQVARPAPRGEARFQALEIQPDELAALPDALRTPAARPALAVAVVRTWWSGRATDLMVRFPAWAVDLKRRPPPTGPGLAAGSGPGRGSGFSSGFSLGSALAEWSDWVLGPSVAAPTSPPAPPAPGTALLGTREWTLVRLESGWPFPWLHGAVWTNLVGPGPPQGASAGAATTGRRTLPGATGILARASRDRAGQVVDIWIAPTGVRWTALVKCVLIVGAGVAGPLFALAALRAALRARRGRCRHCGHVVEPALAGHDWVIAMIDVGRAQPTRLVTCPECGHATAVLDTAGSKDAGGSQETGEPAKPPAGSAGTPFRP